MSKIMSEPEKLATEGRRELLGRTLGLVALSTTYALPALALDANNGNQDWDSDKDAPEKIELSKKQLHDLAYNAGNFHQQMVQQLVGEFRQAGNSFERALSNLLQELRGRELIGSREVGQLNRIVHLIFNPDRFQNTQVREIFEEIKKNPHPSLIAIMIAGIAVSATTPSTLIPNTSRSSQADLYGAIGGAIAGFLLGGLGGAIIGGVAGGIAASVVASIP